MTRLVAPTEEEENFILQKAVAFAREENIKVSNAFVRTQFIFNDILDSRYSKDCLEV